ncbi:MAG: glycosyltransferase [Patescibacteria group bacterium]
MQKAIIVLPTYNERENIYAMLTSILKQQEVIPHWELHILVVDDSSPDGTGRIVKRIAGDHPRVHLISGPKKGLGLAYIRGFRYAMRELRADVVFEMDADFSHNPNDLPRLIQEIDKGYSFVIGSRYVPGGTIPTSWSLLRKANSSLANMLTRNIAGIKNIKDCTGGFRAIRTTLLKKMSLQKLGVKGYAFQIGLLHEAIKRKAKIKEIPIHFKDRILGKSKIQLKDIVEFIKYTFILRFPFLKYTKLMLLNFCFGMLIGSLIFFQDFFSLPVLTRTEYLIMLMSLFSILMTIQVLFTLYWMIYGWEDAEKVAKNKSPKVFAKPSYSFTALIPARNEERVIADTITAIASTNYPESLMEVLVICRYDDRETIAKVEETIHRLNKQNIRLVIFYDEPINKPHTLNVGLQYAKNDVVVIFDAEDEPHQDIYHIVNTIMLQEKADVVQSGVQLMNYRSHWFSTLNVLEYFFWFKSALHWFASLGAVPLGGNTVFFKKKYLDEMGGWNESFLTEDADIGIRLSLAGAKIRVVYDEKHATREETPNTIDGFIKQRTRWNQGFLQVLMQGDWMEFRNNKQKFLTFYILFWPEAQAFLFFYLPFAITIAIIEQLPVVVVLLTLLPVALLLLQMVVYLVGLYEFTKEYKLKLPFWLPFKVIFTFLPYQFLLSISAVRGVFRHIRSKNSWEKTLHLNAHRTEEAQKALSY